MGDRRKGIVLAVLTIILVFIVSSLLLDLGFTIIIYWVYNIIDAYQSAKRYNTYVQQTGRPP